MFMQVVLVREWSIGHKVICSLAMFSIFVASVNLFITIYLIYISAKYILQCVRHPWRHLQYHLRNLLLRHRGTARLPGDAPVYRVAWECERAKMFWTP